MTSTTACNKTFYVGFAFLRHEDREYYEWLVSQIKIVWTDIRQPTGPITTLLDKDEALIGAFALLLPTTTLLLCQWHINKNVVARVKTGGYFTGAEALQEWQNLWFAVVNAPTPAAFLEARANLAIGDPGQTTRWSTTLYEYLLKEWLIEGMREKHCRAWTNKLLHFGKLTTSTAESGHWGIKRGLESSLGDLATVVQSIHTKLDDQLQEIHLRHEDQKSGAMLAMHNAPVFRYLRFEVSINAIEYMFLQWEQLTKESTCLPRCTRVF